MRQGLFVFWLLAIGNHQPSVNKNLADDCPLIASRTFRLLLILLGSMREGHD